MTGREPGNRPAPEEEYSANLFRSFWVAGYEGADHVNGNGVPLAMAAASGHLERLEEDYALLAGFGIRTVRESVGWRLSEPRCGRYDFATLDRTARAARRAGIEVLWTLLHYGWPRDLCLRDAAFVPRFARFAEAAARRIRALCPDEAPVYTPINEISFLAYAVSDTNLIDPYLDDRRLDGYEAKCRLAAAAIAAGEAILAVDPRARLLQCDPVIHVVGACGPPEHAARAATIRSWQWQAWDMLAGRTEPALGGCARMLDILGVHHYHSSQWEHPSGRRLCWHGRDPRRVPFAALLAEVDRRYGRPIAVTETSHFGDGRGRWIEEMTDEVIDARASGTAVGALCIYPIVDRPDWNDLGHWHHSGLWDVASDAGGERRRVLCEPYAQALRSCQQRLHEPTGKRSPKNPTTTEISMSTIIVFSHLRWDFVYQRPQQLLTRLAHHYRVLFVEEPMRSDDSPYLERFAPCPNVEVLRPRTPLDAGGFHDAQIPVVGPLLDRFIADHRIEDYVAWLYTPMALPLVTRLAPRSIVYDCMDELSMFKHAPRQLVQRENALLRVADLVFTGGPSLYRAKQSRHPAVHCFPSSVDRAHFARAKSVPPHRELAGIARPRLGYFGVIDERMDYGLLDAIAQARPDWNLVMVGPVVKVDVGDLPQRPNIHWMGQHGYEELPSLAAGWDACLLPFALNDSTRFVSPTKTLEYMAAGKPVVSTPVADVAELYGEAVAIAADTAAFIAACDRVLAEDAAARALRAEQAERILSRTSWDATAAHMRRLLGRASAAGTAAAEAAAAIARRPAAEPAARHPVVVLGAGPTGLAAALHLGRSSLLLEKNDRVGGWCRSVVDDGFTFDFAGHIMFSKDPYVLDLYGKLLADNVHWQDREAWIWSKGVYTRYPFQGALYGLPPQVLKECIVGAIEARFGQLKADDGGGRDTSPPKNFEEFIYKVWGAGVARHFAIPYNRKLWAVPLDEMETSWLGGRVPLPDLEEMIEGALSPAPKPMGPNARFGYPLRGGFQAMMDGFLPLLEGELRTGAEVVAVSPSRHTVHVADGRAFAYDSLISTLPLPKLVEAIGLEAPEEIRAAARALRHVSVRCVNLGIGRADITDKHWIYYPEDTVFHRIFAQGNASPHCNPPGGFGLTCEISYSGQKPLPCDGDALVRRCIDDCRRVGIISPADPVVAANQVDMPIAYVVYDHGRAANVERIRNWLAQHDVLLAGRYAEWEYYNSDHAFVAGRKAAERVLAARSVAENKAKSA